MATRRAEPLAEGLRPRALRCGVFGGLVESLTVELVAAEIFTRQDLPWPRRKSLPPSKNFGSSAEAKRARCIIRPVDERFAILENPVQKPRGFTPKFTQGLILRQYPRQDSNL
jgi:hypothetical protein